MEYKFGGSLTNQKTVLGHPSGLFVLFFTEMWERFSYYGMRALLVLFLVASVFDEGWGWDRADALTLYAFYTGLVYVTPIFGGLIADKITGYRKAVVIGALLMTLGHASMALEGLTGTFFYLGLVLLIIGNGMFKPNISSMVGKLYKTEDKEKDAGYTIFYMGINAGAFLGILLCGYIGESVGWHYGFGLAGIFMFVGMLQFYFAQEIFGKIGLSPKGAEDFDDAMEDALEETEDAIEDTIEEAKSSKVVSDRLIVIGVLAFFTIFFWWAFEQAGGSMTIFAADYTDRVLEGDGALMFKIFNTLLTVIPMIIITWVLGMLFKQTYAKFALSNILLGLSFVIIWAIVIWMLYRQFTDPAPEVPASWFGILNSFFIIAFAPIFSKIWESKLNPSGPVKFAI
ncbi:peptide MFS transporter, partial [Nonlabens ulvanivorans]